MSVKKNTTTGKKQNSANNAKEEEKSLLETQDTSPLMAEFSDSSTASSTRTRRNAASTMTRSDRYKNIEDGLVPWKYTTGSKYQKAGPKAIDIEEAVALCQKAYYNFSVFRNTIDLMTEFSVSDVYLRGGSKKSRQFFEALFRKINIIEFMDKFFREYYRSGNVFVYRFDSVLRKEDLRKITQTFGSGLSSLSQDNSLLIPTKYMILNPADVRLTGSLTFNSGTYSKVVTDYELQKLQNPTSEEEKELAESLPQEVKKQLKSKKISSVLIPLDTQKVQAIFYKKQDYEPFAVPMGYPVLEDINAKAEMKKIDMAIARTMQQAILLVTMGSEPEKGGVNQKNLQAMQKLFANESVGRVLIADYTTQAEFVVPKIGELMDSKKYEIFDKDIRMGLNNILIGEDEKFANTSIKVKIFIKRLKQARKTFINDFLFPEIKRICRQLGFKNFPTPYFEDIDIRDELSYAKVYNRLMELGVLTPEEGLKAIESGKLPDLEESVENQNVFKELREKGIYQPLVGGKVNLDDNEDEGEEVSQPAPQPGRPDGTDGIPQDNPRTPTDNQSPASSFFSLTKVKDNLILAQKLTSEVEKELRSKHKIKRLTNKQKEVANCISEVIIANEQSEDWINNIKQYVDSPIDTNAARTKEINKLAAEHQVDYYLASILYASTKEN